MKRALTAFMLVLFIASCSTGTGKVEKLRFFADVYAWYQDGKIVKASPGDGVYIQGCVNPAGTHVIYAGGASGPPRIWMTNLSTGQKRALTPATSSARHPVFSWDGKRIAFISSRASSAEPQQIKDMPATGTPPKNSSSQIFLMNADGSAVKQITQGDVQDQRPTFSPDGKQIAFIRTVGEKWQIFIASADGSGEVRHLLTPNRAYRPWFAKDGQSIYFQTNDKGQDHIARIPLSGDEITILNRDSKGNTRGSFVDPNQDVLLVHSTRSGDFGIWEMELDGSNMRQLIPPGYERALHPTRSVNGILTFDAYRNELAESSLIKTQVAKGDYRFPGPPVFTVSFPEDFREKAPNKQFDQVYSGRLPSGFNVQIVVSDIPKNQKLAEAGPVYANDVIAASFNTAVKILSNEEQTLPGGIKAYLTTFQWTARSGATVISYIRSAYKDSKLIQINGHAWGDPVRILQILNSLSFR